MSMWRISRFVFRSFSPRSSAAVSSVEAIDVGRVALCLALALALTLPAPGRTDAIEIAALESAARSGSPVLAAARARAREVLVLAEVAGLRGDPELALWVRNAFPTVTDTADRPLAVEVEVVQPVRWPGKRDALEELAAAETQAALYEVEVAEQQLVGELRRTFAELYSTDREQRALAESHELLELLHATARARFGDAQEGALAVLEAELAKDEHDQDLDQVFARFQAARAKLAALAGVGPEVLPLLVGELPEPVFAVREGPLPFGPEAPSVRAAELRLEAALRRLDAVRLGLKPDFGVGGGFLWPEGENAELTVRFGMELPFLRRRRLGPQVTAAESAVAAARADLAAAEVAGRAEAVRLGAERDRLERSLARLAGAIVPRTSVALDLARSAFLNGEVPFPRLLELWYDWFHARTELTNAEAARYGVWAESQALAGVPLAALPPESRP
ncbi:MAG: outer membrane protein heavy metal efflux system [Acidobacteriota bacterium]|nr:outer membrane protein heavy metal efflux system [Acidobacteriota bacterium]